MSMYIQTLQNATQYNYLNSLGRMNGFNQADLVFGKRTAANNSFVNTSGIQNLSAMKTSAGKLLEASQNLAKSDTFNRTSVASSNTNALTAASSGSNTASFAPMQVDIDQIAAGQTNRGTALEATRLSGFGGTHTFEIEINGSVHEISFNASHIDNNRSVQQKMAAAINRADLGVTASVANGADNTSVLSITANNTGANARNRFEIRDVDGGNIVERTGADNITQQAQDAVFRVNGQERTSASNTVSLNNDISITLRAATTQSVTVSVAPDQTFATDQVREMVSSFNSLMSAARSNQNVNSRLHNDLSGVLSSFRPMLESIGVDVADDGTLSINEQRLEAAAQQHTSAGKTSSRLQDFFTQRGVNSFTSRVSSIADRAANNPQTYAAKATPGTANFSSSRNNTVNFDPFNASQADLFSLFSGRGNLLQMYNQTTNMGYLLNLFI
ncbi:MAG: flagellar filament capping protein FliD [Oscillospiraceae bacterium]|nr:flagellar filament capping protein FliD [Oscillospiraceae bacterium]